MRIFGWIELEVVSFSPVHLKKMVLPSSIQILHIYNYYNLLRNHLFVSFFTNDRFHLSKILPCALCTAIVTLSVNLPLTSVECDK